MNVDGVLSTKHNRLVGLSAAGSAFEFVQGYSLIAAFC